MNALEIKGLKKSFRSNFLIQTYRILKGIDLHAETGEIYGFLGPNGAGKTTTIKCILGLITPDSGEILINGSPAISPKIRNILGFLPENPYFYDYLNAEELLRFNGQLFSLSRAEIRDRTRKLLKRVGLEGQEGLLLKRYSKGMTQRIGLAQALIGDPEFLILDEPFSGLDPIGRKELRDIILALKDEGKTIFFSSHILQDAEMIVDRVGIILDGRIIREGKLHEMISHGVQYHEVVCTQIDEKVLAGIHPEFVRKDDRFTLKVKLPGGIDTIIGSILREGGKIDSVTPVKMTLEEIFLRELQEGK
jgi:ABC-2 type transport system ATP-binding protein